MTFFAAFFVVKKKVKKIKKKKNYKKKNLVTTVTTLTTITTVTNVTTANTVTTAGLSLKSQIQLGTESENAIFVLFWLDNPSN